MTKQQIIEQITELTGIPRSEVRKSIEGLLEVLTQAFTNGQSVYLRGFGTFNVVQSKPRKARIISTGEQCVVPARNHLKFKPCNELKNRIK